jgi:hypothetical protein
MEVGRLTAAVAGQAEPWLQRAGKVYGRVSPRADE